MGRTDADARSLSSRAISATRLAVANFSGSKPMRFPNLTIRPARLLAGLVLSAFAGTPALAAVFTVSNLNDSGAGSLRHALLSANATPGADVVDFAPGLSGVIPVSSGQLLISESVAVNGPGADLIALDAGALSRVLQITAGQAVISGLTFRNGRARPLQSGGGIFVGGDLTLTRCAVVNCEAPLNPGMNADGGGIFTNSGRRLIVDRSLISNCRVALGTGGGIRGASSAVLEISNTTITGCSATQGGALSSSNGLTLNFVTFANNTATHSGGGIWAQPGPFRISNSIVARNNAPSGPDCLGPAQSLGFNIVGNPINSSGWVASDLGGVDPLFGTFEVHGSGLACFDLLPNSPARDAANPLNFLAFDQRDVARPQGSLPDIGAFEAEILNQPPTADAGPDQRIGAEGASTNVMLDGSASSDPDGDELTFAWFENGNQIASGVSPTVGFTLGVHTVRLVVTDPSGEWDEDEVVITVADTTAPLIRNPFASPRVLWPPNNQMRNVLVSFSVTDASDPRPASWLTVTSDEPESGIWRGDKAGDIQIVNKNLLKLRAERSPYGNGRVYTITIHARDREGNVATRSLRVVVPRKRCRWHRD